MLVVPFIKKGAMRGLFLLVLLPTKGDLSLYINWRGICLIDACSKLFLSILVRRSQIVMEEFDMDTNKLPPGLRYHRWDFYCDHRTSQMQGTWT
jgi:hypothetical protein